MAHPLDVLWPDATVDRLTADYDSVQVDISESTGRRCRVIAEGQIGYQLTGFWDAVVVESATPRDCSSLC